MKEKVAEFITAMENKIKSLEQAISQAVNQTEQWVKNHSGLVGMLQATKEALQQAKDVMNSPVTEEILQDAEKVVNVVDTIEHAP